MIDPTNAAEHALPGPRAKDRAPDRARPDTRGRFAIARELLAARRIDARPRCTALVLACLAAATFGSPLAGQASSSWPFGGEGVAGVKRDLWCLGALGAKASDADVAEREAGGTGVRSVSLTDADPNDEGPKRLRVELLLPGGPAASAGLVAGDVIVGVGRRDFGGGSLAPLAAALADALDAKEAKDAVLSLRVERGGASRPESIEVPVEAFGKAFAKPTSREARALLAERALTWLAARQRADGGFAETLSGTNGAVVQTCTAGLAWIAGGSSLAAGPYRDNLERAVSFVRANVGKDSRLAPEGGANWNQSNWGWAHAGLFLGELAQHEASDEQRALLRDDLERVVAGLFAGQEPSGGWGHGPGGPNALGYVELNIVAGLALGALGLAQQAGVELDAERLARALEYVKASSSGGGVGYSTREGQIGFGNIGRTAAAWLGYRTLGCGSNAKSMGTYVKRNASEVLGGHASLMQHVLLAGLASQAQGGAAEKTYWATIERDLLLAACPDGSLQPRPWSESIATGSNSDVSFGEVWTTAAWALVLAADGAIAGSRGLVGWTGTP